MILIALFVFGSMWGFLLSVQTPDAARGGFVLMGGAVVAFIYGLPLVLIAMLFFFFVRRLEARRAGGTIGGGPEVAGEILIIAYVIFGLIMMGETARVMSLISRD